MGLFSSFFDSGKSIEKMTDAVIAGGDMLILTDEEKKQYEIEKEKQRIKWLAAYEPFKLAQRMLAMVIAIPYMIAWVLTFGLSFMVDVTSQQRLLDGDVSVAFWLVVGFYFAGGAASGLFDKLGSAFAGKVK